MYVSVICSCESLGVVKTRPLFKKLLEIAIMTAQFIAYEQNS